MKSAGALIHTLLMVRALATKILLRRWQQLVQAGYFVHTFPYLLFMVPLSLYGAYDYLHGLGLHLTPASIAYFTLAVCLVVWAKSVSAHPIKMSDSALMLLSLPLNARVLLPLLALRAQAQVAFVLCMGYALLALLSPALTLQLISSLCAVLGHLALAAALRPQYALRLLLILLGASFASSSLMPIFLLFCLAVSFLSWNRAKLAEEFADMRFAAVISNLKHLGLSEKVRRAHEIRKPSIIQLRHFGSSPFDAALYRNSAALYMAVPYVIPFFLLPIAQHLSLLSILDRSNVPYTLFCFVGMLSCSGYSSRSMLPIGLYVDRAALCLPLAGLCSITVLLSYLVWYLLWPNTIAFDAATIVFGLLSSMLICVLSNWIHGGGVLLSAELRKLAWGLALIPFVLAALGLAMGSLWMASAFALLFAVALFFREKLGQLGIEHPV